MEIKKHIYTEQEAYLKLSALCASAEYCEYDLQKKMRNWEVVKDNGQRRKDNGNVSRLYFLSSPKGAIH